MAASYIVAATALNLRAAASANATVLKVLRRDDRCDATGEVVDGWLPVTLLGVAGFVSASFVRAVANTDAAAGTVARLASSPPTTASPRPMAVGGPAPDVDVKQRDRAQLHPNFRATLIKLLAQSAAENIPFRVFEAYRTPERQEWLYAQGRTRSGAVVTKARAWESFHQYGLAADLVLFIDGQWRWSDDGPLRAHWRRLGEMASDVGLRTLDWEAPHVEWPVSIAEVTGPAMLASADEGWRDNLEAICTRWLAAGGRGGPDVLLADRPALPVGH